LILGLLEPTSGQLDVLGRRATRLARLRSQIGYVPQRLGIDMNFPASVKDVIISGCYGQLAMFQRLPAKRKARVGELMDLTGVSVYADQPIGDLSVGQQQRVFITRALVADPQLLIVDEPTSGVDIAGQARFFELIGSLRKEFALTVIMVSHNIDQLAKHADYLVCLNRTLHWHDTKRPLDLHMIEEVYGCELRAHIDHYHTEGHHH
jgi:zinc transport system ATP-binding protein